MNAEFFQTAMGQRFYEHTMPDMVQQLADLTDVVHQLVDLLQQGVDADKERMDKKDKPYNW